MLDIKKLIYMKAIILAILSSCYSNINACVSYNPAPTTLSTSATDIKGIATSATCLFVSDAAGFQIIPYSLISECTYNSTPSSALFPSATPGKLSISGNCLAVGISNASQVDTFSLTGCGGTFNFPSLNTLDGNSPIVAFSPSGCLAVGLAFGASTTNNRVYLYPASSCNYAGVIRDTQIGAPLSNVIDLAFSSDDNCLFIADQGNNKVYVSPKVTGCTYTGLLTELALPSGFTTVTALAVNNNNGCLAISDTNNVYFYSSISACTYTYQNRSLALANANPTGMAFNASNCLLVSHTNTIDIYSSQAAPTNIVISPNTLPNSILNVIYSQQLSATGGIAPYTFAVTSGILPSGLSLSSNGLLSGTPTVTGVYSFDITATDSNNNIGTQSYALSVAQVNSELRTELLIRNSNRNFIPSVRGTPIVLEAIAPEEAIPPLTYLWTSNDPEADGRTTKTIIINPTVTSQYGVTITDSSGVRYLKHRAPGGAIFYSSIFTVIALPNTQNINRSSLSTAISDYSSCSIINNAFRSKLIKRDVLPSGGNTSNNPGTIGGIQNPPVRIVVAPQGELSQAIAGSESPQIILPPSDNPVIINAYPASTVTEVPAGSLITLILNLTTGSLTSPLIYTLVDANGNSISQIDNNVFTFTPSISTNYIGFITDANGIVTLLSNRISISLSSLNILCSPAALQGAGLKC